MVEQVERTRKAEHRTRSELVREALRNYVEPRRLAAENPTLSEVRAIRKGEAAYQSGDYVTLDEYLREVDAYPRRARKKVS